MSVFAAATFGGTSSGSLDSASEESSKSTSKTLAKDAEKNRKRELEEGFNNITDQRPERIRTFRDMADDFFNGYKLRLPDSTVFAEYAIGHLKRLLGVQDARRFHRGSCHQVSERPPRRRSRAQEHQ